MHHQMQTGSDSINITISVHSFVVRSQFLKTTSSRLQKYQAYLNFTSALAVMFLDYSLRQIVHVDLHGTLRAPLIYFTFMCSKYKLCANEMILNSLYVEFIFMLVDGLGRHWCLY